MRAVIPPWGGETAIDLVPLIADVECGHVPPYLPIVNGALGRLRYSADEVSLTQTLG